MLLLRLSLCIAHHSLHAPTYRVVDGDSVVDCASCYSIPSSSHVVVALLDPSPFGLINPIVIGYPRAPNSPPNSPISHPTDLLRLSDSTQPEESIYLHTVFDLCLYGTGFSRIARLAGNTSNQHQRARLSMAVSISIGIYVCAGSADGAEHVAELRWSFLSPCAESSSPSGSGDRGLG